MKNETPKVEKEFSCLAFLLGGTLLSAVFFKLPRRELHQLCPPSFPFVKVMELSKPSHIFARIPPITFASQQTIKTINRGIISEAYLSSESSKNYFYKLHKSNKGFLLLNYIYMNELLTATEIYYPTTANSFTELSIGLGTKSKVGVSLDFYYNFFGDIRHAFGIRTGLDLPFQETRIG